MTTHTHANRLPFHKGEANREGKEGREDRNKMTKQQRPSKNGECKGKKGYMWAKQKTLTCLLPWLVA